MIPKSFQCKASAFFSLLAIFIASPVRADSAAERAAIRQAMDSVAKSVVRIELIGAAPAGGEISVEAPISGTIVDSDGYVITAGWAFEEEPASILVVTSDDQRLPATIVARDHGREWILLKVKTKGKLPAVALPAELDLTVGQWVVAVGRGMATPDAVVSVGILSAKSRMWGKAIQVDARLSPPFYGGPVVDIRGNFLGMVAPLMPSGPGGGGDKNEWYDSGIGFAVPADQISKRIEKLKRGEDVYRGLVGVVPKGRDPYAPRAQISAARAFSPAAKAGLKTGDVITKINDRDITRFADLQAALGPLDAGDVIRLTYKRNDETKSVEIELTAEIPAFRPRQIGVLAEDTDDGVKLTHVFKDSPAMKAGFKIGDIVTTIDSTDVETIESMRSLIVNQEPKQPLEVAIRRGDETVASTLTLDEFPREISDDLPNYEPSDGRWEIKQHELPDVANKAMVLRPKKPEDDDDFGLLVLCTPRMKERDAEKYLEGWQTAAKRQGLVVAAVQSADPRRWRPDEADVVVKLAKHLTAAMPIDSKRIVVGGEGAGASMGLLVGMNNRDQFRGVIIPPGTRPGGFRLEENTPDTPLRILFVGGKDLPVWSGAFEKSGFVFNTFESSAKKPLEDDPVRQAIGQWNRVLRRM